MNPRCKLISHLISTTNPLNPWLEQFRQWAYTIFQNWLWVKILQKFYVFVFSVQFEKFHSALQGTLRDSATHRTHRKVLAPFSFSGLQFFFPFSFRTIFSHFNKSNFRYVFTKTIILLGLESHSNKLHFPDKTKKVKFLPVIGFQDRTNYCQSCLTRTSVLLALIRSRILAVVHIEPCKLLNTPFMHFKATRTLQIIHEFGRKHSETTMLKSC